MNEGMDRRAFLAASGLGLAALGLSQAPALPMLEAAPSPEPAPELLWELSGEAGMCSTWDGISAEELRMYAG